MAGMTATCNTAGNPFNVLKVILGLITANLTTTHTYKNISPNVGEITIQVDPAGPGNVTVGDGTVSTTDAGAVLAPGDSKTWGEGHRGTISLAALFFTVSANATIVHLEWST